MKDYRRNGLQDLAIIALPILIFILLEKGRIFKADTNSTSNFRSKVTLLKDISPFFLEEDQVILGKVQDIFEILNRFTRIINNDYQENVSALKQNLSMLDRKEMILTKLANYLDDDRKKLAESVVGTKQNIFKTKENLERYSQTVSTQNTDKLTSMLKLANSIEPILPEKGKVQLRKIEKIIDIIKASDNEFKPYY